METSGPGFPDGQRSSRQSDIPGEWADRSEPPFDFRVMGGGSGPYNEWDNTYTPEATGDPGFNGGAVQENKTGDLRPPDVPDSYFPEPDATG